MSEPVAAERGHVFSGLHNLRDLGGLPAGSGRQLRRDVLLRSDSPHEASEADIGYLLDDLGVTTVVDLRSERELAADGTNALMPETVRHLHFPIAAGPGGAIDGAPSGQRLAARYREYLDQDTESVVGAVRAVATAGEGATIVHCRVGKDRTGIVIALVLDAVGVPAEQVATDYARTAGPMRELMQRLRASATYAANVSRLPEEMYSSEAPTMLAFLEALHATDGGAARWLLAHGLTQDELDALHRRLVQPTDAPTEEGSTE